MGLREDILDMKKEVTNMKNHSMAMEMLSDYKRQNKRQFVIIIILIIVWFITLLYLLIVLEKSNIEYKTSDEIAYTHIHNIKDNTIHLG